MNQDVFATMRIFLRFIPGLLSEEADSSGSDVVSGHAEPCDKKTEAPQTVRGAKVSLWRKKLTNSAGLVRLSFRHLGQCHESGFDIRPVHVVGIEFPHMEATYVRVCDQHAAIRPQLRGAHAVGARVGPQS